MPMKPDATHETKIQPGIPAAPSTQGAAARPIGGEFASAPSNPGHIGTPVPPGDSSPGGSVPDPGTNESPPSLAALLPPPWRHFCEVHERASGIPADMTAVTMMGAIAGLSAGHVVGELGDREVLSNLFMLVATPSGGHKSSCQRLVMAPLFDAQKEAIAGAEDEWENSVRPDVIICEEEIRQARRDFRKDPEDRSIAQRVATLEAAKAGFEQLRPERERYIIDDVTVPSRNRAIIRANRNAVFQCSAEARPHVKALLAGTGRARESEIHLFLTGYSGEPLSLDRVAGNLAATVDAAILSVFFAVQDDLAAAFFADRTLAESGLLARFLGFSFGGESAGKMALGDPEASAALVAWRSHVAGWSAFKKGNARFGPLRVPFTPDAIRLLQSFEPLFPSSAGAGDPIISGYNARHLEQIGRVALNIQMLRGVGRDVTFVDASDIAAAAGFVKRAANDGISMAAKALPPPHQKMADSLTRFLRSSGGMLHLLHGNPSGMSLKALCALADSFPERFKIEAARNGGRGRPQKYLRLR
jgi:hypothetical protein